MTTVSTVGFREVRPLDPAGQVFTMALILVGVGTVLYNLGVILEAVTEGHLRQHLERASHGRAHRALRGHVIICGYGRVGRAAADYLLLNGEEVVLVDNDPTRFDGPRRRRTLRTRRRRQRRQHPASRPASSTPAR